MANQFKVNRLSLKFYELLILIQGKSYSILTELVFTANLAKCASEFEPLLSYHSPIAIYAVLGHIRFRWVDVLFELLRSFR